MLAVASGVSLKFFFILIFLTLCTAFFSDNITLFQHFFLQKALVFISTVKDKPIRNVFSKLFSLYGVYTLEKHVQYLYQGGYAVGPNLLTLVQDSILKLCSELKDDAVALIDVIAPPDFILKSPLGASDGQVRIKAEFNVNLFFH